MMVIIPSLNHQKRKTIMETNTITPAYSLSVAELEAALAAKRKETEALEEQKREIEREARRLEEEKRREIKRKEEEEKAKKLAVETQKTLDSVNKILTDGGCISQLSIDSDGRRFSGTVRKKTEFAGAPIDESIYISSETIFQKYSSSTVKGIRYSMSVHSNTCNRHGSSRRTVSYTKTDTLAAKVVEELNYLCEKVINSRKFQIESKKKENKVKATFDTSAFEYTAKNYFPREGESPVKTEQFAVAIQAYSPEKDAFHLTIKNVYMSADAVNKILEVLKNDTVFMSQKPKSYVPPTPVVEATATTTS